LEKGFWGTPTWVKGVLVWEFYWGILVWVCVSLCQRKNQVFVWVRPCLFRVPPGSPVVARSAGRPGFSLVACAWRGACCLPCLRCLGFVMSTVVFNVFQSAVRSLREALGITHFFLAPEANRLAFNAGVDALRAQHNVGTLYVLTHSYDSDDGLGHCSLTRNIGYFLSEEHAKQAGIEYAFQRGWRFVSKEEYLDYQGDEIFVSVEELFQ